jgi:hypothetical protein
VTMLELDATLTLANPAKLVRSMRKITARIRVSFLSTETRNTKELEETQISIPLVDSVDLMLSKKDSASNFRKISHSKWLDLFSVQESQCLTL